MWKVYPKWTSLLHFINVGPTVICDVLRPIELHFSQRQHKLYLIFLHFKFFEMWANLQLSLNVRQK